MSTGQSVLDHLRRIEIFQGLTDVELLHVAAVCKMRRLADGADVFREGDAGDEMMIILAGCVRVALTTRQPDGSVTPNTINMLYTGQSFGEMVLLGGANRSATVTCVEATTLLVLTEHDFAGICERNPRIGYLVMRNIAADLAYKLRSSNLLLRGNIRWQHGELGKH
ncbi:Crp/Fnr family transcriptional regulator [Candidatus Chloroploca asiatica]|uniref:Cyclic nucleotide-binding protein n=1 Tax=Candidatus Chloroploca asiatica TaxID=1506545 RepID=A0A2H3L567_9CHLR|nr:cyclic nucleotide-binding domain-containing protein [Candidatus Chloroploca asiatica]PDW00010.1 cyclic nucleotide-binding protein [Candidatus Chloroploca asiatica]